MQNTGLLLVGPVLLVNGLATLGVIAARGTAPLNVIVGAIQLIFPTIILTQAADDPGLINDTWPTLLFGITYLYYGINVLANIDQRGFGWFSAVVSVIAAMQALMSAGDDPVYAVIWLTWALMWGLFFALLAADCHALTRFTGWVLVVGGIPTCIVASLFMLNGRWSHDPVAGILALSALGGGLVLSAILARSPLARSVG